VLDGVCVTEESTGRFLWAAADPPSTIDFRFAASEDERRSVDEIALAELSGLVAANRKLLEADDPAVNYARVIGLARLSKSARERINEAVAIVRAHLDASFV
jgi:hypothetical protein